MYDIADELTCPTTVSATTISSTTALMTSSSSTLPTTSTSSSTLNIVTTSSTITLPSSDWATSATTTINDSTDCLSTAAAGKDILKVTNTALETESNAVEPVTARTAPLTTQPSTLSSATSLRLSFSRVSQVNDSTDLPSVIPTSTVTVFSTPAQLSNHVILSSSSLATTTKKATTTPSLSAPTPTQPLLNGSSIPGRIALNEDTKEALMLTQILAEISADKKQQMGYQRSEFLLDCQYAGYSCSPDRWVMYNIIVYRVISDVLYTNNII